MWSIVTCPSGCRIEQRSLQNISTITESSVAQGLSLWFKIHNASFVWIRLTKEMLYSRANSRSHSWKGLGPGSYFHLLWVYKCFLENPSTTRTWRHSNGVGRWQYFIHFLLHFCYCTGRTQKSPTRWLWLTFQDSLHNFICMVLFCFVFAKACYRKGGCT